jgi:D-methionine transport system ATP-binding protein
MIELRTITKVYHHSGQALIALDDISMTVNPGEIVGVIGKSGAGKSTLIRCVNLLECPTAGEVIIDGQALSTLKTKQLRHARRQMGMIFQQFNLLSDVTVFENVALPLRLARWKAPQIEKTVMPLLELVGLVDKKNSYPAQLSGGQKQRVAIARALATQPKILLCDEATSALDPHNTEAILRLLRRINQEFNLTILLITHEMMVIKYICDRVMVLDQGRLIEQGTVAQLFADPQTAVAKHFVASILQTELPLLLREKITASPQENAIPVWRIYFRGHSAAEPIIAQLSQQYGVTLNILQANVECIQRFTMGIMIAAVENSGVELNSAMTYLLNKGLSVETIGYVARDVI